MVDSPRYQELPDDELMALELRYWNAFNNAAPNVRRDRRERWREIIDEVRRRDAFDQVIWR